MTDASASPVSRVAILLTPYCTESINRHSPNEYLLHIDYVSRKIKSIHLRAMSQCSGQPSELTAIIILLFYPKGSQGKRRFKQYQIQPNSGVF